MAISVLKAVSRGVIAGLPSIYGTEIYNNIELGNQ